MCVCVCVCVCVRADVRGLTKILHYLFVASGMRHSKDNIA